MFIHKDVKAKPNTFVSRMKLIRADPVCLRDKQRQPINFLAVRRRRAFIDRYHDIVVVPELKVGVQRGLAESERVQSRN